MRRNVLEVKDLVRNYRKSVIKESEEDVKVLKGINFQVAEGEFVGIMGKSGCGKAYGLSGKEIVIGIEEQNYQREEKVTDKQAVYSDNTFD